MMKVCTKCSISKELNKFRSNRPGKLDSWCNQCKVDYTKKWRHVNEVYFREYRRRHWQTIREIENERRRNNRPEKLKVYIREYSRVRMQDPHERLAHRIRNRLRDMVRGRRPASSIESLGVSIEEFKLYIEHQFYARFDGLKMGWHNTKLWHLDHVVALASFDLQDPMQYREACDWLNYQPLWIEDNLSKGTDIGVPIK